MAVLPERAAVRRLHDRFGSGPRQGDLDAGFTETLDRLLTPGPDAGAQATPLPQLGATPPRPGKQDTAAAHPAAKGGQRTGTLAAELDIVAGLIEAG